VISKSWIIGMLEHGMLEQKGNAGMVEDWNIGILGKDQR
jgi:hypothetical protein